MPHDYAGLLRYNPDTGEFRWLVERYRRIKPGALASALNGSGYIVINITVNGKRERWRAHRLAWFLMTGEHVKQIDHINGIRNDNRWNNLREVTSSLNMLNPNNKVRSDNVSGKTGVSWQAAVNKWHARITVRGQDHLLGFFTDLDAAIAARRQAEIAFDL